MTITDVSVRRLLRSHHSTLWGRAFDISDEEGMTACVNFIMDFLVRAEAMNDHLTSRERHAVL